MKNLCRSIAYKMTSNDKRNKKTQVIKRWLTVETIVKGGWIKTIQYNQDKKISVTIQTMQHHQLKDTVDE